MLVAWPAIAMLTHPVNVKDSSAGTFPSRTPTTRWIARGFRVDTPLHCPSGRTLRNLPHARAETAVHGGPRDARPPN